MKKLLLVLFLTLFTATVNFAQSMSDEDVMEYVKTGVKQGKTQKQLYQELLIKGVTKEQFGPKNTSFPTVTGQQSKTVKLKLA